jgi:hypothetical protein
MGGYHNGSEVDKRADKLTFKERGTNKQQTLQVNGSMWINPRQR